LELGKFTFSKYELEAAEPKFNLSSKDTFYWETHYFGAPGGYRKYVIGSYSRAYEFSDELVPLVSNTIEMDMNKIADYRKIAKPNFYAVFSFIDSVENEVLLWALFPYHGTVDSAAGRYKPKSE
jgi:hypothetical protein